MAQFSVINADGFLKTNGLQGPAGAAGAPGTSQITLLKAGSGTNSTYSSTNVDTVAITGLTNLDTLIVEWLIEAVTTNLVTCALVNTTDSVSFFQMRGSNANFAAGLGAMGTVRVRQFTSSNKSIMCTQFAYNNGGTSFIAQGNPTFTTAWTGNWTLALQMTAVSAGSVKWMWAVYKLAGQ